MELGTKNRAEAIEREKKEYRRNKTVGLEQQGVENTDRERGQDIEGQNNKEQRKNTKRTKVLK